jgi:AcrR family transcriptional regulator
MSVKEELMEAIKRKEDVRSKYTRSLIKDGLIKLLATKEFKEITVKELCHVSQVSRGTFYNQYYDIYDVYSDIEEAVYQESVKRVSPQKVYKIDEAFFKDILVFIQSEKVWFKSLFTHLGESTLFSKIVIYLQNKFIHDFKEISPDLPEETLTLIFSYSITGSVGIISDWVIKGCITSPDVLAKQLALLIQATYEGYTKIVNK